MNSKSLNAFRGLLITLITASAITGISFLDNQIWNIIMAVVGVVTYGIVGLLFSAHIIVGRETGKQAYAAVFIILLVIGFFVYQGILKFEEWILSWPLYVKILVPSIMGCGILATIIILIVNRVKLKRANLSKDSNVEGE